MAKQRYLIFLFCLFCLQICHSLPQLFEKKVLGNLVLDGKKDCKLSGTTDGTKLLKLYLCPQSIAPFSEDYFFQRNILPCLGVYDALYNLCEFPVDKINLTNTLSFNDPGQFCSKAKEIFHNLNFTYEGDEIKKWSDALRRTMQDEKRCNNLCIAGTEINEQCIIMLTLSHEYLRLNTTIIKVTKSAAGQVKTDPIPLKQIKEGSTKLSENSDVTNIGSVKNSIKEVVPTTNAKIDQNSTVPRTEELTKPETHRIEISHINVAAAANNAVLSNVPKDSSTSKTTNPLKNTNIPTKTSPIVKEVAAVKTAESSKDLEGFPSHIQKVPSNTVEDETFNEETSTSQADEMNGNSSPPEENNEGVLPDQKEKEVPRISFLRPSPFPLSPKIQPAKSTPSLSANEESEKPSEEEKPPVDPYPVPQSYPGGVVVHPLKNTYGESEDSYSFTYIVTAMAALTMVYMLFHYRNKLLALALEGRKGRNGRSRGRPSSANYTKLHHSNLEEAIASSVTAPTATHVLY